MTTKPFGILDYLIAFLWLAVAVIFWKLAVIWAVGSFGVFFLVFLRLASHQSYEGYDLWDRFIFLLSFPALLVLTVFLILNGEADGSDIKAIWGVIWYGDEDRFEPVATGADYPDEG